MTTALAGEIMQRLTTAFPAAADPAKAAPMAAYLRDQFPFLGIQSDPRRALGRVVLRGLPTPDAADLRDVALDCWDLPEREYQLFACDWLRRHADRCPPEFLATARVLITTKSWWDTVDALAAHLVGRIVARHRATATLMDDWLDADNLWVVRTSILHQLTYQHDTDADRLFRACAAHAGHRDFFIRKAIGWALRQYARTDPAAVRAFVAAHPELSGLSRREALKHASP